MTLFEVKDLSVCYLTEEQVVLKAVENVSFRLEEGRSLGIVGESGCGKTTVMLALMRLLPEAGRITQGQIILKGQDLLHLSEAEMCDVRWVDISMVFQGAMNAFNPVRTVENQIIEALLHHGITDNKRVARNRARELLDLVGISPEFGKQYPHQYSGGMRQRAIIAMALACEPQILIADEPTTALDVMIQAQIIQLIQKIQKELKLTLILVTHDLGVVAEICDDVVVMYAGEVVEYGTCDDIYNRAEHPYTQRLLQAFPDVENPDMDLISIPGVPPRLDDLPQGCRFAPRCHLHGEKCSPEAPRSYEVELGHWVACHLVRKL
jgi:peptide/nickel transport system ATP-binding protein